MAKSKPIKLDFIVDSEGSALFRQGELIIDHIKLAEYLNMFGERGCRELQTLACRMIHLSEVKLNKISSDRRRSKSKETLF
jgi:hypothetical protein